MSKLLVVICLVVCSVNCRAADLSSSAYQKLEALYLWLHQNPELSFKEENTAARLASELGALGFSVTAKVGRTGVVATLANGPGPTVLIRADMDALPVREQSGVPYASKVSGINVDGKTQPVMHACGHDVHMTVLIGIATQLVQARDQWRGTLVLIAQPAEEIGAGAKAMLDDGLFTRFPRPDFNLALHVHSNLAAGTVGYVAGAALANVDSVDITVYGVGGHGAYPHASKDPIVLSAQIVTALQTIVSREISPLEPAVVTVGSIHGGHKHNIIPNEVNMQLTLRSYTTAVREQTIAAIKRIVKNLAMAAGVPAELLPVVSVKDEFTPVVYNDPDLAERVAGTLRETLGADQVMNMQPVMGGEDFGRYGRVEPRIPSFIFWLGAVDAARILAAQQSDESLPSLHSPLFVPAYEQTIKTGVSAMTAAARELLDTASTH